MVRTRKENTLGIYDMSGNAAEWCWDWLDSGTNRVARGGSFDNHYNSCEVNNRSCECPYERRFPYYGFRVVRSVIPLQ